MAVTSFATGSKQTGANTFSGTAIGNMSASDDVYATSAATKGSYLRIWGFGFAVPAAATINGVEVIIEFVGSTTSMSNSFAQLVTLTNTTSGAGSRIGSNLAVATAVPTTETTWTYGGAANLWGANLTPSIVNAANHAFDFACTGPNSSTVNIDYLAMRIYYTVAPVNLGTRAASALYVGDRADAAFNLGARAFTS